MDTAEIPYSHNVEPTYENFIADCPSCCTKNIFNRASDLQTFEPIEFRAVTCQVCERPFNINNDAINTAHEMLLFGCFAFIKRKEYMQCVLSVAQAYEVFFSHFLYVQLIYRAYANEGSHDLPHLNTLSQKLYCRVKTFTFESMRRLVLRLVVDAIAPASLSAAEVEIEKLRKKPQEVPREDIEAMPDGSSKALLLKLLDAKPNELRNRVVHKDAYRPTLEEAKLVHDEAGEILHGLTDRLRLGYDFYWYISEAGR